MARMPTRYGAGTKNRFQTVAQNPAPLAVAGRGHRHVPGDYMRPAHGTDRKDQQCAGDNAPLAVESQVLAPNGQQCRINHRRWRC